MSEPIQSIAQNNYILHNIDAKKLYVQEPLFTANSGDAVYVGWRPDETVLWENTAAKTTKDVSWPQQLSEDINNFKRVRIYFNADGEVSQGVAPHEYEFDVNPAKNFNVSVYWNPPGTSYLFYRASFINLSGTNLNVARNFTLNYPNGDNNTSGYNYIWKIKGINRKENA